MGNGNRNTKSSEFAELLFDNRGRVEEPRPLDRFFYDRDESGRKEEPERREYDRHRAMFWELLADYFKEGSYSNWWDRYYGQGSTKPEYLTHWPGYGQPGEQFPFGDTESNPPPLKKVPGLNVAPNQPSGPGDVPRPKLRKFHQSWDQTQETFESGRGGYEIYTDINVAIVDGFSGSYQIGDSREIAKTPKNEAYTYVEELHEHLYGMKDGWTWTTISGSKENQCAALGELSWGRSLIEETYVDYQKKEMGTYKNFLDDGVHAWDRQSDGSLRDETTIKNDMIGAVADYGIVVQERLGPIDAADEDWIDTEDPNYSAANSSKHEIWSYTKVGRTGGVEVTEKTISDQSAMTPANKIWSQTKVGSDFTATEQITDSEQRSTLTLGNLYMEEIQDKDGMVTKIQGNDGEEVFGHKWDIHMGNACTVHMGTAEEFFFGGKAEMFAGGKFSLSLGGWLEIVLAIPYSGAVVGGLAGLAGDAWAGAEAHGVGGAIVAGAGGTIAGVLEGLLVPTEIFIGNKNEVHLGGKKDVQLGKVLEVRSKETKTTLFDETKIGAQFKELSAKKTWLGAKAKWLGAKLDLN